MSSIVYMKYLTSFPLRRSYYLRQLMFHLPAMILASILFIGQSVRAQTEMSASRDELRQSYDTAFKAMYQDPVDLDKAARFAELAIAIGDLEGAISTLERMLIYDPDLLQVRMELGILYFRLESFDQASVYLRGVLLDDSVPDEILNQVEIVLQKINERTSIHSFSGAVYAGARYQTNANTSPEDNQILLFGQPALLGNNYIGQADSDLSGRTQLSYVFDFQTDSHDTLNIDLSVQSNWFEDRTELDASVLDLRVGAQLYPRFGAVKKLQTYPYLLANRYDSDQETIISVGGGLGLSRLIGDDGTMSFQAEYQEKKYTIQPQLDSSLASVTLGRHFRLGVQTKISAVGIIRQVDSDTVHESNREIGIGLSLERTFTSLFSQFGPSWRAAFSVSPSSKHYTTPNPTIDPTRRRREQSIQGIVMLGIPFAANKGLNISVGLKLVDSNIPNHEYDNYFFGLNVYTGF